MCRVSMGAAGAAGRARQVGPLPQWRVSGFQGVGAEVHVSSRRRRASAPGEAPAMVEGQGVAAEVLWVAGAA